VNRMMYWTERGGPPRGNTVNRAPMDVVSGKRKEPEIVFTDLVEAIGLAVWKSGVVSAAHKQEPSKAA